MLHVCEIIPFPGARRFDVHNGCMVEVTGFGLEALTVQDAMNINHALRMKADAHERDGEQALARMYRRQMEELSEAWKQVVGRIAV